MSDNYIKKQVEAIRYHSDRLVKSYGGGSYCLKCDNCIDKHPCHICNPEPTIPVSELREWCEERIEQIKESSNVYNLDILLAKRGVYETVLDEFCKVKK